MGNIHVTGETLIGFIQSFEDGQDYQCNKLFGEEEFSFALSLHIDEFEKCNLLGTSRKKHTITAVYWIPLNLPARCCSSLSTIQLVALGKSEGVKLFGFGRFLSPLLRDISVLEKERIYSMLRKTSQCERNHFLCLCR